MPSYVLYTAYKPWYLTLLFICATFALPKPGDTKQEIQYHLSTQFFYYADWYSEVYWPCGREYSLLT